ncbi:MAG: HD domain-containing protein [Clostridia bacterium]|nr:HD domain-containing protein [Clostridia bacterium]
MEKEKSQILLDYFLETENLKQTKRYARYPGYEESVTDHSYFVCFLAIKLIDEYDLKLNFEKVIKMCLYHDLCELDLITDYDSYEASKTKAIKEKKSEYEKERIKQLSQKFSQPDLCKIFSEYKRQETSESKFVKAVDKLETTLHIIKINGTIKNEEFTVSYCDDAIRNFPRLIPFYLLVKQKLKEKYISLGFEWKSNYDF